MPGFWIKVETTTPDKPEVHAIAEQVGIDSDAALGKLIRLWVWADEHTYDGNAAIVTSSLLDRITGVSGFGDAMVKVGWMRKSGDGFTLPNFERHNGKTAKNRALTAKRVAQHRTQKCNASSVTASVSVSESVSLPDGGSPEGGRLGEAMHVELLRKGIRLYGSLKDPAFLPHWYSWLEMRREKGDVVTHTQARAIVDELSRANLKDVIEGIKTSISGGYKKIVLPKNDQGKQRPFVSTAKAEKRLQEMLVEHQAGTPRGSTAMDYAQRYLTDAQRKEPSIVSLLQRLSLPSGSRRSPDEAY